MPGNKYRGQTSREIDREIANEKYKSINNTYKALSTEFGRRPTLQQLQAAGQDYPKPKTILYNLETLRKYSREYPIHLYRELQSESSLFH